MLETEHHKNTIHIHSFLMKGAIVEAVERYSLKEDCGKYQISFLFKVGLEKQGVLFAGARENAKYCPFIMALKVDKPAVDCELEPNNQSAVVSIVISPMGKTKTAKRTHGVTKRRAKAVNVEEK